VIVSIEREREPLRVSCFSASAAGCRMQDAGWERMDNSHFP